MIQMRLKTQADQQSTLQNPRKSQVPRETVAYLLTGGNPYPPPPSSKLMHKLPNTNTNSTVRESTKERCNKRTSDTLSRNARLLYNSLHGAIPTSWHFT